jgi:glycogen phosphorylase
MGFDLREHEPILGEIAMEALIKAHNYEREFYPIYAGGLGGLKGDTLRALTDLGVPIIGIFPAWKFGYFKQGIDPSGLQSSHPDFFDARKAFGEIYEKEVMKNFGRDLHIGVYLNVQEGVTGFKNPLLFLTTDLEENVNEWDRNITGTLYDSSSEEMRISQRNVLGQGSVRILDKLSKNIPSLKNMVLSLEEGHSAFASLLWKNSVFTNHTPVDAGFDRFSYELAYSAVGNILPSNIMDIAGYDCLNMNRLAANMCWLTGTVAEMHAEKCRRMKEFDGRKIVHITNGIHPATWITKYSAKLYNAYIPGWELDPLLFNNASNIPPEAKIEADKESKRDMVDNLNKRYSAGFKENVFTAFHSRRIAKYKRLDLLTKINWDEVATPQRPMQLIIAGKAHPNDQEAKMLLKEVNQYFQDNKNPYLNVIFVPDYDATMLKMFFGSDALLNTPIPDLEASGTSGMKAGANGVLDISTNGGWGFECRKMYPESIHIIGDNSNIINFNPNLEDLIKTDAESATNILKELSTVFYQSPLDSARMKIEAIKPTAFFNTLRLAKEKIDLYGLNWKNKKVSA